MERREVIGWLSGFAVSTAMGPLSGVERYRVAETIHASLGTTTSAFTARQASMVTMLSDLILPATDTPGAVDVGVPRFIEHLVANWFSAQERSDLLAGLAATDRLARSRWGRGFLEATVADRSALLAELDGKDGGPPSAGGAFRRIKSLTVFGYFTSERVQTEVLKTVIVPGRYDGCVPVNG